ncbi:amino acid ABC transporter permease [bacterium]|nr:amino acid ABC transporter permease [bacterium]
MLNNRSFQKLIACLFFVSLITVFYGVTKKFDYNWSWQKVPQYFISTKPILVSAPFDGTLKSLSKNKFEVLAQDGRTFPFEASEKELEIEAGSELYEYDVLASKKNTSFGALLTGLWMTIQISFFAALLSLVIGLSCGLARLSKNPIFNWPATVYVEIIRGTPLLVQLFIIYFMVGSVVGIESRLVCGVLALGLFGGAYSGEIIRAGIESIDKGQMEAARSLGLSHIQSMYYVIFPQMFRRSLAALGGTFISLIKDSSLVSVMALTDLTKAGREIVSSSFMVFEIWIVVAALYFVITFFASILVKKWEAKLAVGER